MSLAEGVSARVAYKPYATGVIESNSQPLSSTDPGPTGGQVLRRVATTIKLGKESYQATEIRSDRQIVDMRHGTRRVTGNVSGEFSPGTYFPLFEAGFRGTATDSADTPLDQTQFTSVTADKAASTITFGSGDPVAEGMRKGSIFSLSGLTGPGVPLNGVTFIAMGFGGVTNSRITVHPAPPADMAAELTFAVNMPGKHLFIPSTGHVRRKFALEVFHEDIESARLYKECRVGGFNIGLPATGLSTIEFPFSGRDMELYDADSPLGVAPFFTSPLPETTSGIFAAVNGMLSVGGTVVGVVTGLTLAMDLQPSSDAVVGQNFVPEVFLGTNNITGQMTAMLEDNTFIRNFLNEDEIEIIVSLATSSAPGSPTVTMLLPRVKFSDADVGVTGLGAQIQTIPFTALKYVGTASGVDQTTMQIFDSAA
jgi:Phage tail tube protein